ncbi:MFS transporter [Azospirillum doebereinerae]|uniref:MFS transporter n=1 Tax=Azospirillum doebereinerae TaxID=92933 RepID=UPI001B3B663B|nr:MFS transporter [Azospirillum doebereinerae]
MSGALSGGRAPGRALRSPRAFIAGLGAAQIVSWGSLIYSFPLLAEPIAAEFGWSKTEVYLLASLALGCSGLTAIPVGSAIDRGQGRAVMAAGSLLAGALLWAWSALPGGWPLVLVFIGLGLAQSMTLYEPGFAVVARRYGADARRGITALTLWGGFASTVFIPLTQLLLDRLGWRGTLEALALVNLALCVPLHLAVIDGRRDATAATSASGAEDRRVVRWALGQPVFWGLAIAFTVYYAIFSALSFHLYPLLIERGLSSAAVVGAMALIGPAQVAGRIVIAAAARRLSIRGIGVATTLALPAAFALLFLADHSTPVLVAFALLYGSANGIMTIVRGAAVPDMLTRSAYGAVNGVLTVPTALLKAVAPTLAALLWQWNGSYGPVIAATVAASLVVVGSFGFAACRRPR